jgi:hypothetical protein
MPDGALGPFLHALSSWQRELPLDQQAALGAAIVLETTSLTRQQVGSAFAGLAWEIPYRQIETQAWHLEG